ncbi:MAG: hypothetical protein VW518_00400 [Burkholderiaceae bacterium]
MSLEVSNAKYSGKVIYRHWKGFTNPPSNFEHFFEGGCSGETAVRYALKQGYTNITLIGFDMRPGRVQNVYKNTPNYATKNDYQPTFTSFQAYLRSIRIDKITRIYAQNYGKPIRGLTNIKVDDYLKEMGF